MVLITNILVGVVAFLHIYFLVLEMFLWDTPFGLKTFGLTPEFATASKTLAANQGLYNGFLSAGLIWGLATGRRDLKIFFLCCVVIAGIFGGLTAKTSILFVQALPAFIALTLVFFTSRNQT